MFYRVKLVYSLKIKRVIATFNVYSCFFFKSETFTWITSKSKTIPSGKSQYVPSMMEGERWLTKKMLIVSLAIALPRWRVDDLHTGQIRLEVMHYNGFYPNDFVMLIYDLSLLAGGNANKQFFLFLRRGDWIQSDLRFNVGVLTALTWVPRFYVIYF